MSDIDDERIRRLDGALLLVLRELLRQRRTTLVANHLGLSQSAVSHALRRLRSLLDDPLFVRRPHGLEPTPRALALRPHVEELLSSMASLIGVADDFDPASDRRTFRICAPDHLAMVLGPELLRVFMDQAPGSRFAFNQRLDDAITALAHHQADVALGRFRSRVPREFASETLLEDQYCLIARDEHPRIGKRVTLNTYGALDHVVISVTGDFNTLDIGIKGTGTAAGRIVAAVPRFVMAFPLVAASDAVAVVPRRLAQLLGAAHAVRWHRLPMPTEPLKVLMVHRREPDAATIWLLNLLRCTYGVASSPIEARRVR